MRFCIALVLVAVGQLALAADVRITEPKTDSIVLTPTVTIKGSAVGNASGDKVRVTVGGTVYEASVSNGAWSVAGVPCVVGNNRVSAKLGPAEDRVLVVRAGDAIANRGQQKIRLHWNDGVDEELKKIAIGTLQPAPAAEQIAEFIAKVKLRVPDIIKEHYDGVANIIIVAANGADVHSIEFLPNSNGLYGESPSDCGSDIPKQTSNVYVGTYRSGMVNSFGEWQPMQQNDDIETRVEDVARCLARTGAHETGHSLGLVGPFGNTPCSWMHGCDGGHNCEDFDDQNSESDRFNDGWYIMDPGPKTANRARLAELLEANRTVPRTPAVFNAFDHAYFKIVHPLP